MNTIERNRFRPTLVTIFWCLFFLSENGINIDHTDGNDLPEIFLVILLASMLIFKIREKILIEKEYIIFDLQNNYLKISILSINELYFLDCFNKISISTNDSKIVLNISHFHSKEVESLFAETTLYNDKPCD